MDHNALELRGTEQNIEDEVNAILQEDREHSAGEAALFGTDPRSIPDEGDLGFLDVLHWGERSFREFG